MILTFELEGNLQILYMKDQEFSLKFLSPVVRWQYFINRGQRKQS